jgi:hypothetical protein
MPAVPSRSVKVMAAVSTPRPATTDSRTYSLPRVAMVAGSKPDPLAETVELIDDVGQPSLRRARSTSVTFALETVHDGLRSKGRTVPSN